jgi:hypothetical protein
MPKTYEPISTQTLSSAVTGVTFTSIPQTYTDLVLVIKASASTAANAWLSTNLTDVSSLSGTRLYADGTGTGTLLYLLPMTKLQQLLVILMQF